MARVDGTAGDDREGGVERDEGAVDIVKMFNCVVLDEMDVVDNDKRGDDAEKVSQERTRLATT